MNKITVCLKPVISCLPIIILLPGWLASSIGAREDNHPGFVHPVAGAGPILWAAGDDTYLYLVLPRQVQEKAGFEIFQRKIIDDRFRSVGRYQGNPDTVAAYNNRLLVFLGSGRSHSYALYSSPRTEAHLPAGWRCLDVAVADKQIYVLAVAHQSALIKRLVPPSLAESPAADNLKDPNQPAAQLETVNNTDDSTGFIKANPGDHFLLRRGKDLQWYSLTPQPLPIDNWHQPRLVVHQDVIYLFGSTTAPDRTLLHCRWENYALGAPQTLPVSHVAALTALNVNRQVRLVVAVGPTEQDSTSVPSPIAPQSYFLIAWPTAGGWRFSAPLEESAGKILTALPSEVSFAACGQNLVAFHRLAEAQIRFGIFSPTGDIVQELTQPLNNLTEKPSPFLQWFFGTQFGLVCLVITILIIYLRREDAFSLAGSLPAHVLPASLPRRMAAFILDIIGPLFVALVLSPEVLHEVHRDLSFQEQSQLILENPRWLKFAATFFLILVGYMTVSELLLAATPGKYALGLTILNDRAAPATTRQILIRNLFRLLEFQTGILVLVLLIITRRRQRAGDLIAHTVVVLKTPDLFRKPARTDEVSDDSDESDSP